MKTQKPFTTALAILFAAFLNFNAKAQCPPGDTAVLADPVYVHDSLEPLGHHMILHGKTAMDTNDKVIFFIPGLGGNSLAWTDVIVETNGPQNQYPLYPARNARAIQFATPSYPGYAQGSNMFAAGDDTYTDMLNVPYSNYGVTDVTANIVIAHSQGGLVAREVDRTMRLNGRTPKFGGIVTFGSPHGGAEILTNGLPYSRGGQNMIQDFGEDMCKDLSDGPLWDSLTTADPFFYKMIRFFSWERKIVDLKNEICEFFAQDVVSWALPGDSVYLTQDYMAHNQHNSVPNHLLNTMNNYTPTIPIVAFYGVEEEPVFWRQMGSLIEGVHTASAFSADADQKFVNDANTTQANYYSKYQVFKGHAKWQEKKRDAFCVFPVIVVTLGIPCMIHTEKRARYYNTQLAYERGYDFLRKANKRWKGIIGARKTGFTMDGFECKCRKLGSWRFTTSIVQNRSDCPVGFNNTPQGMQFCFVRPNVKWTTTKKPNDGVVLAESARNVPGGTVNGNLALEDYELTNCNHQQLRNHPETAAKLNRLFDTNDYDTFFRTNLR